MKPRHVFLTMIAAAMLTLGAGQALALCDEERAAMEAALSAVEKNAEERLLECGNQRICMGEARIAKKECKQSAREEKFACLEECRTLSGREKRQCKQGCRSGKRIAKLSCRILSQGDKDECRTENPQCVELRNQAVILTISGTRTSAAYYECVRETEERPETEEDQEAIENAEEASRTGG